MYEPPKTAFRGASRAILTAGPLCVALSLAAMAYMELPDAIDLEPAALLGIPVVLLFALIFGPFVACSPIAAGTFLMHHLADRFDILSARPAWAAARSRSARDSLRRSGGVRLVLRTVMRRRGPPGRAPGRLRLVRDMCRKPPFPTSLYSAANETRPNEQMSAGEFASNLEVSMSNN